jgi:hypothetical protein
MTEVISHRFVHDFVAPATTQGKSAKHAHLWTRPRGHRTVLGPDSRGGRARAEDGRRRAPRSPARAPAPQTRDPPRPDRRAAEASCVPPADPDPFEALPFPAGIRHGLRGNVR